MKKAISCSLIALCFLAGIATGVNAFQSSYQETEGKFWVSGIIGYNYGNRFIFDSLCSGCEDYALVWFIKSSQEEIKIYPIINMPPRLKKKVGDNVSILLRPMPKEYTAPNLLDKYYEFVR